MSIELAKKKRNIQQLKVYDLNQVIEINFNTFNIQEHTKHVYQWAEKLRIGSKILRTIVKKSENGTSALLIPTVVISKLWSGRSMEQERNESLVLGVISAMRRINLTEPIAKLAGSIRRHQHPPPKF